MAFWMKAHVGVDADSGLIHSVVGTAANVSDVSKAHALLHGHEEQVFADADYTGVDKREEMAGKTVKWYVAAKRVKIKAMQDGALDDLVIAFERTKAQIRSRVEHPFRSSRTCFTIARPDTSAWPRTRHNCSVCSLSRIW